MHSVITQPKGIIPRLEGCPVGPDYAQIAQNIDLTQNGWVPWRQARQVARFDQPVCAGHVRNCCYHAVPVRDARYLDAGVPQRTYLSGPTERPVVTDDLCADQWRYLGYPVTREPYVAVVAAGDTTNPFNQKRVYRVAYATECEVGPVSAPSKAIKVGPKGRVDVTLPGPIDEKWGATHVVIYRLVVMWDPEKGFIDFAEGSLTNGMADVETRAEFFEVGRVPIGTQAFRDDDAMQGPVLATDDLFPPQKGLRLVGETTLNSIVGFEGRNLWFSERNAYWGFPPKARHEFPYEICHAVVCGDRIVVVTTHRVYVVVDDADCRDSMGRTVLEGKQKIQCCGPESCVQLADGVLYTSLEGLMFSDVQGSTTIVSRKAFEKSDWMLLGPNSMRLGMGCNHLFLSTCRGTYVWPLSLDENGLLPEHVSTLSFEVDEWLNDEQGHLYFLNGQCMYEFNGGTEFMEMQWHQAEQRTSRHTHVSSFRVDYKDKKLGTGNKIALYNGERAMKVSDRANQTVRTRNEAGDCFSAGMIGSEPACGLFYGVGKLGLTTTG